MVYLSHPVRRMCRDPFEDTDATLVISSASTTDLDAAIPAIEDAGGTVHTRLQYDAVRVTIPESAVSRLPDIDGIKSIETANTVGIGGDAGEDI